MNLNIFLGNDLYIMFLIKLSILILCSININKINNTHENQINLDNELQPAYESNINFSNYSSILKPIALYYPENNNFNFNYVNSSYNNNYYFKFNNNNNLVGKNNDKIKKIERQIELAKSHGIYGFGIMFIFNFKSTYKKDISFFLNEEKIEFPFLLIWENSNFRKLCNIIKKKVKQKINFSSIVLNKFVNQVKEFFIKRIYIKIKNIPILGITNPLIFDNEEILLLRTIFNKNGIDNIFIICPYELHYLLDDIQSFDAVYDLPNYEFRNKNKDIFKISYYSGIIYKNINLNQFKCNTTIFRSSLSDTGLISKKDPLKFYSPEKFYILNKVIIEWTKKNFEKTEGFFFINSWNDYESGNYLEPDEIYGYASLNSFSKALFNLSFNENDYNLLYLNNICIVAIQAHIFFEDLTFEVINKTNNIPFKFDLFITTVSLNKKIYLEQSIRNYSKAHEYKIDIVENKGRDVLPFIIQMKFNFKKYKYICHIHSKKTQKFPITGNMWRQYLYNNLLGSEEIVSEIINDFEVHKNLGFIFPDTYYNIVKGVKNFESIDFKYHKENIYYIDFVVKQLLGNIKISKQLIFPSGDMFWAKIDAIHQIFEIKFIKMFPKEIGQLNKTIMHAIERLWLYLVKLNGYYYKTIFKIY